MKRKKLTPKQRVLRKWPEAWCWKSPSHMRPLNLQRCAEAMDLLYKTYIINEQTATARGEAIQAINRMILSLGGEDTAAKIEEVPWSARMRESGEPELVKLAEEVKRAVLRHADGDQERK